MPDFDFDLFTIGAGSGGVAASRRAASYGPKVAICESTRVGGTCVLRGCVPKKLLVYASHYAHDFEDAEGFGWQVGPPTIDWAKLIAKKDKELDRLNGIYLRLLRDSGVEIIEGRGEIVGPHTVRVGERQYTARNILIATGGRPSLPDIPGIELAMTSDDALALAELPKRIAVVGGGYIGVEFASIFRSVGVEVTLILRGDNILRGFDLEIRERLAEEMQKQGVRILCDTTVSSIERNENGLSLLLDHEETFETDALLYATGRVPNSSSLGLETVGIETKPMVRSSSTKTTVRPSLTSMR